MSLFLPKDFLYTGSIFSHSEFSLIKNFLQQTELKRNIQNLKFRFSLSFCKEKNNTKQNENQEDRKTSVKTKEKERKKKEKERGRKKERRKKERRSKKRERILPRRLILPSSCPCVYPSFIDFGTLLHKETLSSSMSNRLPAFSPGICSGSSAVCAGYLSRDSLTFCVAP